jgi:hypothetical protein
MMGTKGICEKGVDIREITSGLLVLCLLLSEEACEGDDVGVDLLHLGRFAVCRHLEIFRCDEF